MSALRIIAAGPGTTLQDRGRFGYLRFGVTPAGPMDAISHETALRLAGLPAADAAIEIGPGGITVVAEGDVALGIAAPGASVMREGKPLPDHARILLRHGETLTIRSGAAGVFGYCAAAGSFAFAPVMGSLSTHLRSGIGPLGGRALAAGDLLPLGGDGDAEEWSILAPVLDSAPLRFVPGPQDDYFDADAHRLLQESVFALSQNSDRMGYRLAGPKIIAFRGHDIVSDGIALGAMQVPGDGQLIILMADRQPTGGYPKIGTIIRADLPRLAQSRPGTALRFAPVSIDEAVSAWRTRLDDMQARLAERLPLSRGINLSALMSGDHQSGVADALDRE